MTINANILSLFLRLFGQQLIMFGLNNQLVVTFKEENLVALKFLFVRDYSGVDEDDYSTAVYTQQDAYQSLAFVLDQVWRHTPTESAVVFPVMTNTRLLSSACYRICLFI